MPVLTMVRHGETKLNRAQVVQSRTPGELTEKGVKMAERLGRHLQHEKWTLIYTSDLKRCHDTTLNILKHSKNPQPEPQLREILRERDYGDLEFQPGETVMELIRKHNLPNHKVPIPGGESHEQVMKRCAGIFEEICEVIDNADAEGDDHNILVVTHGAWILCFLDYLKAHPHLYELQDYNHEEATTMPLLNTGNTKIDIEKIASRNNNQAPKRKIKFHHYHCVKHLEGMSDEE